MLMSGKWYKDNDKDKPGLIQRMDWLGFAIFIVAAVGLWMLWAGIQEYQAGKAVHTDHSRRITDLERRIK